MAVPATAFPCTSISPFTAPAITALVAEILPIMTELCPIFTLPSLLTSPTILAPSAESEIDNTLSQPNEEEEKTMDMQTNRVAVDETAVVTEGMTITGDIASRHSYRCQLISAS